MSEYLQPVQADSLAALAHASIREAIISGQLAMGEKLVERQLAERLGMSRPPIRQALQRLGQEGLVEERPRRGAYVCTINADDFIGLSNARMGIESTCARLIIAQRRSVDGLAVLLPPLAKAAKRSDAREFVAADMNFHRAICAAAGNRHLQRMFDALAGQIRLALGEIQRDRADLEAVAEGHAELVEVLSGDDPQRAADALENHVRIAALRLVGRLGGDAKNLLEPAPAAGLATRPEAMT